MFAEAVAESGQIVGTGRTVAGHPASAAAGHIVEVGILAVCIEGLLVVQVVVVAAAAEWLLLIDNRGRSATFPRPARTGLRLHKDPAPGLGEQP